LALFVAVEAALGITVALLVAWLGVYDVAATRGHWPITECFLHFVMQRSVAAHAPQVAAPDLNDPVLVLQGAAHFYGSCGPCHGAPDEIASPIARQITPPPPGLYSASAEFTPQELFWIVKNGVKMTAMPAWPVKQRDDEIWAMVAFLEQLPKTKPSAFDKFAGILPDAEASQTSLPSIKIADQQRGFDLAECSRCHGPDGNGRGGAFPRLTGLSDAYLAQSLHSFQTEDRPSGFMKVIVSGMSEAEIQAAAAYYSALPVTSPPASTLAAVPIGLGRQLVDDGDPASGIAACSSCHVPDAPLRHPAVPDIAGQPVGYFAQQLRLLGTGIRKSLGGTQDEVSAHHLTAPQISAVAAYLALLPSSPSAAAK
jgi:cytochrome c553